MDKDYILDRSIPEPNSGCWIWLKSVNVLGYGVCGHDGKTCLAHRLSYAAFKGTINGLLVLHKCDNPSCVNPDHLFLGTPQDNMDDMVSKHRHISGTAKITKEQSIAIRNTSKSNRELATEYGVSYDIIYNIKRGKTWR